MLEYISLTLLLCMVIFIVYLVIYIHDTPYEIAKKRNHPHADAIHIAGWVSLFLMHTIWPLLWIWAYLYKPGEKFLSVDISTTETREQAEKIKKLEARVDQLTEELARLNSLNSSISQEV